MPITAISRLLQAMMRHNFTFALLSHIPADRIPGEWSTLAALQGRWLTRKGQLVEAEAVLTRAKKRWPSDGHIAINHAFVAEARGDLGAFAERWRAILGHHPDLPLAHAGLGGALRKLGRLEQAHDVLKAAQARFPEDTHIAMESAWLAHDRGEHLDAIALWQRFSVQSPERFEGPLGLSTALRALLRFDEADQVLEAAIQRFPGVPVLASNHAVNADARGDRPLALARWQRVLEDFPDEPISHAGVGAALKATGEFDAADRVLANAMARFPADANLGINHAWVADAKQDWAQAAQRWRALLERFPQHPIIRNGASESAMKAQLSLLDKAENGNASADVKQGNEERSHQQVDADRALLMQFEALGENCELGFVQRHFGAEPLGLFRWAGISCERLIAALNTSFNGIGDPEYTTMSVNPHNHEYFTEDRRYGMSMHTFLLEDAPKREKIFQTICRRLEFLKEKLLHDLREAQKIFVYQSAQALSEAEWRGLLAALRRHGSVTLLYVRVTDDPSQAGQVICAEPGLLLGFLDRAGYDGKRWDVAFDQWLNICQNAAALAAAPDLNVEQAVS